MQKNKKIPLNQKTTELLRTSSEFQKTLLKNPAERSVGPNQSMKESEAEVVSSKISTRSYTGKC
jgi:hypothetical protein